MNMSNLSSNARSVMHFVAKGIVFPALLLASAAMAGPPVPTVTPIDFFPIDYLNNKLVAYAAGTNSPSDRMGVEVSGNVPLQMLMTQGRHDSVVPLTSEKIIYLIDGTPVSGVLSAPYTFSWNSASVSDGAHALSVVLVDGPTAELANYRIEPTVLIVTNRGGLGKVPQRVPALGGSQQSVRFNSATPDWVSYPGGSQPPHPVARPFPHKTIPPAYSLADPSAALVDNNWMVEPMTQAITGLYAGRPRFFQTKNGHVVIKQFNTQSGSSTEGATPHIASHANYDGARNDNAVSSYSTIVPVPGTVHWMGVDLGGRLFQLFADGSVTTLAGEVTRRDVLPLDKNDASISAALRKATQKQTVGIFAGGVEFSMPTDLAIDPRNHNIVYVADPGNFRIAKVDLSASPARISTYAGTGAAGALDGPVATATFTRPWSIAMAADGTLFVADKDADAIRKVSPDGATVSTVVGASAGIVRPFVIRLDSNGQLILSESTNAKPRVLRVDPVTKAVSMITDVGCRSEWVWLDVDRKANVGPKDDIFLICGTGGAGNTDMRRISSDGARNKLVLSGTGPIFQGNLAIAQDAHGHYPWVVAIADSEARILTAGFGNVGLNMLRMKTALDPVPLTGDGGIFGAFGKGRQIFQRGTVSGFPFGARPSFNSLLGETGHGYLGIKNFDELESMSDADLGAYIQAGMGGSVPRPEITGNDLAALIYYVRMNSLSALSTLPSVPKIFSDKTAAAISDVSVTAVDATTARIQWNTDEPTLGYVAFGPSAAYHRWSDLESGYSTSHSALLKYLPANQTIHYAIRAKDNAGNQTLTDDRSFVTSGSVVLPAPSLVFSATPSAVTAGGTAVLSWAASDAAACVTSGGWSQAVGLSGSVSTAPLSASTDFTLTCSGAGTPVVRTVRVSVMPSGPVVAPTLSISSPATGARITGTSLSVSYTRGGDQSGVASVVLQLDGNAPVSTTTSSYVFANVPVGVHTVRAWLANAAGARIGAEVQVQVTMDVVPAVTPTLAITSPAAGSHTSDSSITVGFARGGNQTGVDHAELQLNDGPIVRTSANSYVFTNVAVGTHIVHVWLATAGGAPIADTRASVQVTRDAPPPPPPPSSANSAGGSESSGGGGCTIGGSAAGDASLPLLIFAAVLVLVRRYRRAARPSGKAAAL